MRPHLLYPGMSFIACSAPLAGQRQSDFDPVRGQAARLVNEGTVAGLVIP